ncbi:MAG: hypothetical protein E7445_02375 [Ruminococcaceae bacterium]|nr:hypothetical protein [Oscillospiraceae bacterium]
MTMNSVIEYVDGVKPNVYTDEDKYRWLNQLEGMLSAEVFHDPEPLSYDIPADADRALRVGHPYDELYSLYVMAMIDFHNREYGNYNNTMLMFRQRLEQLKDHCIRIRSGTPAQRFRKVMG